MGENHVFWQQNVIFLGKFGGILASFLYFSQNVNLLGGVGRFESDIFKTTCFIVFRFVMLVYKQFYCNAVKLQKATLNTFADIQYIVTIFIQIVVEFCVTGGYYY